VKILLIVDQLSKDKQVINFGAMLARHTDSNLTLLHVAPRQEGKAEGWE